MKTMPGLLISLLFFSTLAFAQPAPSNLAGLDGVVEQTMKDWNVPGVALAIVKDGTVVYAKGYGYRDVNRGLRVTPDTLFAIGSCSKAFTAAALGMLVDEKKLEWDKPLRDYLPDLRLYDEYATAHIRPRDLVTHQSGLPRHDLVWYGSPLSRRELFERLRYLEPSAPLHAKYQYNNLMFMTAGMLVERLSGMSWEDFVRRRILDPLDMKTATLSVTAAQKADDYSLPYAEENGAIKEIPFRHIDAIGPAGSINASVNEMANWLFLQLNKGRRGEQQLISEKSLLETQTPQIVSGGDLKYDETFYSSYAMGWAVNVYRGHPALEAAEERYQLAFLAHLQCVPEQAELLQYWRSVEAFAYQQIFCISTGIDLWAGKPGKRTFCLWKRAEEVIASKGYRPVGLREVRNSLPFPRVSRHFPRKVYLEYLGRVAPEETTVLQSHELLRQNMRAAGILNEAGLLI